jgi:hypothetical protein
MAINLPTPEKLLVNPQTGRIDFDWFTALQALARAQNADWTRMQKDADQTSTSTTLANDTSLLFEMPAGAKFLLRGEIFYDTPTAADFKWRHTGPASPALVNIARYALSPDDIAFSAIGTDEAYSATDITVTGAVGTFGTVRFSGIVHNGSTKGNFVIQWAQNAASGTTTVRAGSYIEYRTL